MSEIASFRGIDKDGNTVLDKDVVKIQLVVTENNHVLQEWNVGGEPDKTPHTGADHGKLGEEPGRPLAYPLSTGALGDAPKE